MKRALIAGLLSAALVGWSCNGGGTGPSNGPPPPPPPPVAPTVTSINPTSGGTLGGTSVTITGTGFASGATVTIAGVAATNVAVSNATTITAVTGVSSEVVIGNVVVTNTGNLVGTLTNGYDYRPVLVARPGGPYDVIAERDITVNGTTSSSHPYPITNFRWDCGQLVFPHHRVNCQPDAPTPTFRYRKEGFIRDGPRDYTVTLEIQDARGNRSAVASTRMRVQMIY